MTREVEELLLEVLVELPKFLRRENDQRQREELQQRLSEIRAKRWGYPTLRRRGR
jgi:hypothetical protein